MKKNIISIACMLALCACGAKSYQSQGENNFSVNVSGGDGLFGSSEILIDIDHDTGGCEMEYEGQFAASDGSPASVALPINRTSYITVSDMEGGPIYGQHSTINTRVYQFTLAPRRGDSYNMQYTVKDGKYSLSLSNNGKKVPVNGWGKCDSGYVEDDGVF